MGLFLLVVDGNSTHTIKLPVGSCKGPWKIRPWLDKIRDPYVTCSQRTNFEVDAVA